MTVCLTVGVSALHAIAVSISQIVERIGSFFVMFIYLFDYATIEITEKQSNYWDWKSVNSDFTGRIQLFCFSLLSNRGSFVYIVGVFFNEEDEDHNDE